MPIIIKTHATTVKLDVSDDAAHALSSATNARTIIRRGDVNDKLNAAKVLDDARPIVSGLATEMLANAANGCKRNDGTIDWSRRDATMRLVMKCYRAVR